MKTLILGIGGQDGFFLSHLLAESGQARSVKMHHDINGCIVVQYRLGKGVLTEGATSTRIPRK